MDESSKVREDIKIDKVIKKNKIDNKSFNDIFNSKVPINKQLVKYREPEPLLLAKSLQFELSIIFRLYESSRRDAISRYIYYKRYEGIQEC